MSSTAATTGQHAQFIDIGNGTPDGLRCDIDGNLWWVGNGHAELDGVNIYTPDGT